MRGSPSTGVCRILIAIAIAALAGFSAASVAVGVIGLVLHSLSAVADLAGIVGGVTVALDWLCAWRKVFPASFAAVFVIIPHLAWVAIGSVIAIGATSTCPGGWGTVRCPDGGPGLGGEVGGGPTEEEQGEPIEESIRTQWHGLSPEYASSQRL